MTLIEILVALVVVAMVAGGVVFSINAVTRARLRSACMTFSAAARYAYGRAISEGSTVRLTFDFEKNTMKFEEAHGRVTLARRDDARREAEGNGQAAVDPWEAAQARLDDGLRPSLGSSPFTPLSGRRFKERRLSAGVRIEQLMVGHEPEPKTSGEGAIYFFPGGQTEHAVLWLSDGRDRVYATELHPLTGRTRIYTYAYEPEELLDDGEGSSRSEVDD